MSIDLVVGADVHEFDFISGEYFICDPYIASYPKRSKVSFCPRKLMIFQNGVMWVENENFNSFCSLLV